jgi:hypothetical protein
VVDRSGGPASLWGQYPKPAARSIRRRALRALVDGWEKRERGREGVRE